MFQKKGTGTTCLRQNDTSGLFFFKSQVCGLAGRAKLPPSPPSSLIATTGQEGYGETGRGKISHKKKEFFGFLGLKRGILGL